MPAGFINASLSERRSLRCRSAKSVSAGLLVHRQQFDLIIDYDIKYRLGLDGDNEEECT
jgi:hypothetical protein